MRNAGKCIEQNHARKCAFCWGWVRLFFCFCHVGIMLLICWSSVSQKAKYSLEIQWRWRRQLTCFIIIQVFFPPLLTATCLSVFIYLFYSKLSNRFSYWTATRILFCQRMADQLVWKRRLSFVVHSGDENWKLVFLPDVCLFASGTASLPTLVPPSLWSKMLMKSLNAFGQIRWTLGELWNEVNRQDQD